MRTLLVSRVGMVVACVVVVAGLSAGGCAGKKKGQVSGEELGPYAGAPGVGEEGLAGASSIEQFQETGTVASGGPYKDVHFAFDSFQIDGTAMEAVRHNAAILQADQTRRVEIEGHCDERGSSEYNLALGAKRARAVKEALIGLGISADRMDTVSYGEELPLCREPNETCWAMNRRAHLVDR